MRKQISEGKDDCRSMMRKQGKEDPAIKQLIGLADGLTSLSRHHNRITHPKSFRTSSWRRSCSGRRTAVGRVLRHRGQTLQGMFSPGSTLGAPIGATPLKTPRSP